LDAALKEVFDAHVTAEEETAVLLLSHVKEFGNYIAPGLEETYKRALLREYRSFCLDATRKK
jgi:hypothetical protein